MFRTFPLSIIRSFPLYTQQWYMSYRFRPDPARKLSAHIPLLCVQWKSLDDGQRNCPKDVEFYSKNKFEKWVHLVGFIIRICHNIIWRGWYGPRSDMDQEVIHNPFYRCHVCDVLKADSSRPILRCCSGVLHFPVSRSFRNLKLKYRRT